MKNKKILFLVQAAMIAALYVVLTEVSNIFGLASNAIQVRVSEALTVLPFFTPAAIPGLFIGCIVSNLLVSANIFDIIFGSLATLIGALVTYLIGRIAKNPAKEASAGQLEADSNKVSRRYKIAAWFAPIPPILANTIVVPFVLKYAYGIEPLWLSFLTVGAGEMISCGILGIPLIFALRKYANRIF